MIPDPQTGRFIARLLENDAESSGEFQAPDGRRYRKRSAPEPGVRATLEVAEPGMAPQRAMTIFEPQDVRPAGYPAALPFVPGTVAVVHHAVTYPPSMIVVWRELADDDAFDRRLVATCEAEGWRVVAEPGQRFEEPTAPRELHRGEERRLVSRLPRHGEHGGGVMLVQSAIPTGHR
jgi:hypothetical protein